MTETELAERQTDMKQRRAQGEPAYKTAVVVGVKDAPLALPPLDRKMTTEEQKQRARLRSRRTYQNHPEYWRQRYEDNYVPALLKEARRRAEKSNVPYALVESDIVIPAKCPVLGIDLKIGKGRHGPDSPSLDRITPELGYVPGNVAVISWRANVVKNNGSLDEHEQVVAWLLRMHIRGCGQAGQLSGTYKDAPPRQTEPTAPLEAETV